MTLTLKATPACSPFLEQLKNQIIRDYELAKVLESDTCDRCLNGHTPKYQCPVCTDLAYCETHVAQHVSFLHHDEGFYEQVRATTVRKLMRMGIVSAFFTPDHTITVSEKHPMTYNSVLVHGSRTPRLLKTSNTGHQPAKGL